MQGPSRLSSRTCSLTTRTSWRIGPSVWRRASAKRLPRLAAQQEAPGGSPATVLADPTTQRQEGGLANPPTSEADAAPSSFVSAPLLVKGSGTAKYLALALRLPTAATSAQRRRGQRGVSLDLILDSGSTVNVLMPAVARELDLPVVGVQAAGAGAAGGIAAAPIYLAGDVQLDYLPPEQRFTLMTGLQLAGLAVPSPACSGILGRAFIDCFEAVELRFAGASSSSGSSDGGGSSGSSGSDGVGNGGELSVGSSSGSSGQAADGAAAQDGAVASGSGGAAAAAGSSGGASAAAGVVSNGGSGYELRLHAQYVPSEKEQEVDGKGGLTRVPLQLLGETGLWGVQMRVSRPSDAGDGPGAQDAVVMVPALVDTGAPMTILNTAAAEALGLGAGPAPPPPPPAPKPAGLFGAIGKLLSGGGGGGPQLQGAVGGLRRLEKELELSVACDAEGGWAPMGAVRLMVGDLPGFAALGIAAGQPGAILGLDALTRVGTVVLLPKGGPAMLLGAPVDGAPEWA